MEKPLLRRFALDEWLCALLLSAMVAIAFANVLGRFLFDYSLAFTEELTINFFVYVVILGAGLGFEQLIHPKFESLFSRFPEAGRAALIVLSYLLTVFLFAALLWATWRAIYVDMTLFHSTSPALGLPSWYYDAPVFLCVLLALRRLWRGFKIEMRNNRQGAGHES